MSNSYNSSKKHDRLAWSGMAVLPAEPIRTLAGVVIIFLLAVISYYPSLSGGFIWDDHLLLIDNLLIDAPDGLYRLSCTSQSPEYHPLTNTTLWIEWRLWDMNSTGYHCTNLILHIAESLLIWVVLRKLSIPGAFLAAMIFAIHPVNVESVAWIAQRKNLTAMLFLLLSIHWYLKAAMSMSSGEITPGRFHGGPWERGTISSFILHPSSFHFWYWLSLGAFLLAMLSKGSAAILPVLLLGIIWWLRPLTRRDLVRSAPFFLISVLLTIVHMWFQTHGSGDEIRTAGFLERLLGAGCVVWFYLYKALLPLDLAFVYSEWHIQAGNLLWWLPLLAVLAVTAVLWHYRESWSRTFLFAWGFFCAALVPVMGFTDAFFMRFSLVADHYQHIAIIGIITLVSAGWSIWRQRPRDVTRWTTTIVAIVIMGILTSLTWQQTGLYRSEIILLQDSLEKNPDSWLAQNNLGFALLQTGRTGEAIEHCRRALALKSDYADAHNNLGAALVQAGRPEEAFEHYNQALLLNPDFVEAHNNLGVWLAKKGRAQEAIEHYQQAIKLKSDYPDVHVNLGAALVQTGRPQEAVEHYRLALRLKPDNPEAYNNLGFALVQTGRLEEALENYRQALRQKPDYPEALNNLAIALADAGRLQEAIENLNQALKLNPNYSEAHYNLGNLLFQTGRRQEAIEHYEKALAFNPDYPEVHCNLANALAQTGRAQEAIEHYQQALAIKSDYPEVHNNLGAVLVQGGRSREAIEHFKQALQLRPDYISACSNLALAYAKMHQSSEAISAARKAIELARSQGLTVQAKQIEDWLNSYRSTLPDLPTVPPGSK